MATLFDEAYTRSISDPAGFWGAAANEVHWFRKWDRVLDDSRAPFTRWFAGAFGVAPQVWRANQRDRDRNGGPPPVWRR